MVLTATIATIAAYTVLITFSVMVISSSLKKAYSMRNAWQSYTDAV